MFAELNLVTEGLLSGLQDFMPGYVEEVDDPDNPGATKRVVHRGTFSLHELHTNSALLGKDPAFASGARAVFLQAYLAILDGSGTLTFLPVDSLSHAALFCYFKGKSQLRWYVVCDVFGRILFVSTVYPGKNDDNTILEPTGYYE